ncbi:protein NLRC3-like isoform X2 [Periophthalmus magnuspinnatus]|uniref:protein NLRC3-like isoform X2 n=1 Tax=Periophthalmus magnuspinnatus TaxID=409849 RepID=UPI0024364A1B|nr:protein NLRC3-like isoform X2 [Periophthalmus magnuspinnatus]
MASRKGTGSEPPVGPPVLFSEAHSYGNPKMKSGSRGPSPVPASVWSDHSMGHPISFKEAQCLYSTRVKSGSRGPSPVPASVWSDHSMGHPISFKEAQCLYSTRRETGSPKPGPSCVSFKSNDSMGHPIAFLSDPVLPVCRQELSPEGHHSQLDIIFMNLEKDIISFVRAELQSFKRVVEFDYPESFESEESGEQRTKETFLHLTVDFLRRMKQGKMADHLQSRYIHKVQRKLKSSLQQKFQCVFEGVARAGNPTLLNQIYTELYITKGGTEGVNEEHEVRQIETTLGRQAESETTIKCEDIFEISLQEPGNMRNRLPIRTVLTKGVAGIGKTVLTQKFCLDWAEGRANQNIHLLFPFTFRELNVLRDKQFSLIGLVHHFFSGLNEIRSFEHIQVVFIFDGLDECRLSLDFNQTKALTDITESTSLDVLLVNLLRGTLLPYAQIWITTRPAAANQILARYITVVTEVRGFTDEQKQQYFRRRFQDETQAIAIIAHIKASRSLYIMCHIPIFCWIAATVLEHIIKSKSRDLLPQTLTEMYIYFLVVQIKAKSLKYDGKSEVELQWSPTNIEMVESLAKLAFDQLLSGNLIFYESDLVQCGLDVDAVSSYSGVFTQVFREEPGLYQDKVYCFVHLSVQEFLAALHAHHIFANFGVNLLSTVQSSADTTPKKDFYQCAVDLALESQTGHLDLFLRFLLGLSLPTNQKLLKDLLTQTGSRSEVHQKTLNHIKQRLNEGLSTEKSINLFHCLNELKDRSLVDKIQWYVNGLQGLSTTLTPAEWSALAFLLLSMDLDVFDLKIYQASEWVLLRLMPVVKASKKALLSTCNLSEGCCAPLGSVLSSPSSNLRHLDLSQNPIQDSGMDLLSSGLQSQGCRLETLNLSICNLSWKSGGCLSSVLCSQSPSLKHLDLSNNDLQDSGVEQLSAGLRSAGCRLETLSLSGCLVSEESGWSLASALTTPGSSLKSLDLSYNNPGPSAVDLLSRLWEDPQAPLETLNLEPAGFRWLNQGLKKYFCVHSLDSNTAYRQLHLSDRTVTRVPTDINYPLHRDRFDYWPQVLCCNALSGRCYWEVEWQADWPGEKTRGVDIAVSYRSIGRKGEGGECGFGFNSQSWSLMVCYGFYCFRHNGNESRVGTFTASRKGRVAVYLDYPAGALSFYRVSKEQLIHIHTVNITFTGQLFAGFGVWSGTAVTLK